MADTQWLFSSSTVNFTDQKVDVDLVDTSTGTHMRLKFRGRKFVKAVAAAEDWFRRAKCGELISGAELTL